jgi:hypothetical protein
MLTLDPPDRRRRPRLRLAYPLRLYRPGDDIQIGTETENISCEGFFFITDQVFFPREALDCDLEIPVETGDGIVLCCRVEVVRVVPLTERTKLGVACRFTDYTVGYRTRDQGEVESALAAVLATPSRS